MADATLDLLHTYRYYLPMNFVSLALTIVVLATIIFLALVSLLGLCLGIYTLYRRISGKHSAE